MRSSKGIKYYNLLKELAKPCLSPTEDCFAKCAAHFCAIDEEKYEYNTIEAALILSNILGTIRKDSRPEVVANLTQKILNRSKGERSEIIIHISRVIKSHYRKSLYERLNKCFDFDPLIDKYMECSELEKISKLNMSQNFVSSNIDMDNNMENVWVLIRNNHYCAVPPELHISEFEIMVSVYDDTDLIIHRELETWCPNLQLALIKILTYNNDIEFQSTIFCKDCSTNAESIFKSVTWDNLPLTILQLCPFDTSAWLGICVLKYAAGIASASDIQVLLDQIWRLKLEQTFDDLCTIHTINDAIEENSQKPRYITYEKDRNISDYNLNNELKYSKNLSYTKSSTKNHHFEIPMSYDKSVLYNDMSINSTENRSINEYTRNQAASQGKFVYKVPTIDWNKVFSNGEWNLLSCIRQALLNYKDINKITQSVSPKLIGNLAAENILENSSNITKALLISENEFPVYKKRNILLKLNTSHLSYKYDKDKLNEFNQLLHNTQLSAEKHEATLYKSLNYNIFKKNYYMKSLCLRKSELKKESNYHSYNTEPKRKINNTNLNFADTYSPKLSSNNMVLLEDLMGIDKNIDIIHRSPLKPINLNNRYWPELWDDHESYQSDAVDTTIYSPISVKDISKKTKEMELSELLNMLESPNRVKQSDKPVLNMPLRFQDDSNNKNTSPKTLTNSQFFDHHNIDQLPVDLFSKTLVSRLGLVKTQKLLNTITNSTFTNRIDIIIKETSEMLTLVWHIFLSLQGLRHKSKNSIFDPYITPREFHNYNRSEISLENQIFPYNQERHRNEVKLAGISEKIYTKKNIQLNKHLMKLISYKHFNNIPKISEITSNLPLSIRHENYIIPKSQPVIKSYLSNKKHMNFTAARYESVNSFSTVIRDYKKLDFFYKSEKHNRYIKKNLPINKNSSYNPVKKTINRLSNSQLYSEYNISQALTLRSKMNISSYSKVQYSHLDRNNNIYLASNSFDSFLENPTNQSYNTSPSEDRKENLVNIDTVSNILEDFKNDLSVTKDKSKKNLISDPLLELDISSTMDILGSTLCHPDESLSFVNEYKNSFSPASMLHRALLFESQRLNSYTNNKTDPLLGGVFREDLERTQVLSSPSVSSDTEILSSRTINLNNTSLDILNMTLDNKSYIYRNSPRINSPNLKRSSISQISPVTNTLNLEHHLLDYNDVLNYFPDSQNNEPRFQYLSCKNNLRELELIAGPQQRLTTNRIQNCIKTPNIHINNFHISQDLYYFGEPLIHSDLELNEVSWKNIIPNESFEYKTNVNNIISSKKIHKMSSLDTSSNISDTEMSDVFLQFAGKASKNDAILNSRIQLFENSDLINKSYGSHYIENEFQEIKQKKKSYRKYAQKKFIFYHVSKNNKISLYSKYNKQKKLFYLDMNNRLNQCSFASNITPDKKKKSSMIEDEVSFYLGEINQNTEDKTPEDDFINIDSHNNNVILSRIIAKTHSQYYPRKYLRSIARTCKYSGFVCLLNESTAKEYFDIDITLKDSLEIIIGPKKNLSEFTLSEIYDQNFNDETKKNSPYDLTFAEYTQKNKVNNMDCRKNNSERYNIIKNDTNLSNSRFQFNKDILSKNKKLKIFKNEHKINQRQLSRFIFSDDNIEYPLIEIDPKDDKENIISNIDKVEDEMLISPNKKSPNSNISQNKSKIDAFLGIASKFKFKNFHSKSQSQNTALIENEKESSIQIGEKGLLDEIILHDVDDPEYIKLYMNENFFYSKEDNEYSKSQSISMLNDDIQHNLSTELNLDQSKDYYKLDNNIDLIQENEKVINPNPYSKKISSTEKSSTGEFIKNIDINKFQLVSSIFLHNQRLNNNYHKESQQNLNESSPKNQTETHTQKVDNQMNDNSIKNSDKSYLNITNDKIGENKSILNDNVENYNQIHNDNFIDDQSSKEKDIQKSDNSTISKSQEVQNDIRLKKDLNLQQRNQSSDLIRGSLENTKINISDEEENLRYIYNRKRKPYSLNFSAQRSSKHTADKRILDLPNVNINDTKYLEIPIVISESSDSWNLSTSNSSEELEPLNKYENIKCYQPMCTKCNNYTVDNFDKETKIKNQVNMKINKLDNYLKMNVKRINFRTIQLIIYTESEIFLDITFNNILESDIINFAFNLFDTGFSITISKDSKIIFSEQFQFEIMAGYFMLYGSKVSVLSVKKESYGQKLCPNFSNWKQLTTLSTSWPSINSFLKSKLRWETIGSIIKLLHKSRLAMSNSHRNIAAITKKFIISKTLQIERYKEAKKKSILLNTNYNQTSDVFSDNYSDSFNDDKSIFQSDSISDLSSQKNNIEIDVKKTTEILENIENSKFIEQDQISNGSEMDLAKDIINLLEEYKLGPTNFAECSYIKEYIDQSRFKTLNKNGCCKSIITRNLNIKPHKIKKCKTFQKFFDINSKSLRPLEVNQNYLTNNKIKSFKYDRKNTIKDKLYNLPETNSDKNMIYQYSMNSKKSFLTSMINSNFKNNSIFSDLRNKKVRNSIQLKSINKSNCSYRKRCLMYGRAFKRCITQKNIIKIKYLSKKKVEKNRQQLFKDSYLNMNIYSNILREAKNNSIFLYNKHLHRRDQYLNHNIMISFISSRSLANSFGTFVNEESGTDVNKYIHESNVINNHIRKISIIIHKLDIFLQSIIGSLQVEQIKPLYGDIKSQLQAKDKIYNLRKSHEFTQIKYLNSIYNMLSYQTIKYSKENDPTLLFASNTDNKIKTSISKSNIIYTNKSKNQNIKDINIRVIDKSVLQEKYINAIDYSKNDYKNNKIHYKSSKHNIQSIMKIWKILLQMKTNKLYNFSQKHLIYDYLIKTIKYYFIIRNKNQFKKYIINKSKNISYQQDFSELCLPYIRKKLDYKFNIKDQNRPSYKIYLKGIKYTYSFPKFKYYFILKKISKIRKPSFRTQILYNDIISLTKHHLNQYFRDFQIFSNNISTTKYYKCSIKKKNQPWFQTKKILSDKTVKSLLIKQNIVSNKTLSKMFHTGYNKKCRQFLNPKPFIFASNLNIPKKTIDHNYYMHKLEQVIAFETLTNNNFGEWLNIDIKFSEIANNLNSIPSKLLGSSFVFDDSKIILISEIADIADIILQTTEAIISGFPTVASILRTKACITINDLHNLLISHIKRYSNIN